MCTVPAEIQGLFDSKYNYILRSGFTCEPSIDGISINGDGGYQRRHGYWAQICYRKDIGCHEVHGQICEEWCLQGGCQGWLGYPTSDEDVYIGDGDDADRISHFEHGDIIWNARTSTTRCVAIEAGKVLRCGPRWYSARRDELLRLFSKSKCLNIPERYRCELDTAEKKCRENAFEILLVGAYQGGKSTTFDALCDGRDLSPRGRGIKTSAAVISAQNISDGESKEGRREWAEVIFKDKREIILGMVDVLNMALVLAPDCLRPIGVDPKEMLPGEVLAKKIDLDDVTHRSLVDNALSLVWKFWEENKGKSIPSDSEMDMFDILRIATLQIRYFRSPEYVATTSRTVFDVSELTIGLASFPKDWSDRWKSGRDANFSFFEVQFIYVKSVLLRLHSRNLERIGCRLTDCPGLFAGAYDTSVTRDAISRADAIWYLIDGDREISASDLKRLTAIIREGATTERIIVTSNYQTDKEYKIDKILSSSRSRLEPFGVRIFPYNARLAFLAKQGERLLLGQNPLAEYEIVNMRIDAKANDGTEPLETLWRTMVRKIGNHIDVEEVQNVEGLTAETVSLVERESFLAPIIENLESDIIRRKAESILVTHGASRTIKALKDYEGGLKVREDAAWADMDDWHRKTDVARRELREFIAQAKRCISKVPAFSDPLAKSEQLAKNFAKDMLGNEFIEDVRDRYKQVVLKHTVWTKKMFEAEFSPKFVDAVFESLKTACNRQRERWTVEESKGLRDVREQIIALHKDIEAAWRLGKLDEKLEMELDLSPVSNFEAGLKKELGEKVCSMDSPVWLMVKENFSFANLLNSLKDWSENVILSATGALAKVLGKSWLEAEKFACSIELFMQNVRAVQEAKLNNLIKDSVESMFMKDATVCENLADKFAGDFLKYIEKIRESKDGEIDRLSIRFEEERVKPAEAEFSKSMADRKRIAEENRRIREEQIIPLRERIEEFKAQVKLEIDQAL